MQRGGAFSRVTQIKALLTSIFQAAATRDFTYQALLRLVTFQCTTWFLVITVLLTL